MGYELKWACGSGVVNYSGLAAVGYELQWACGSGVVNYSGPAAVGYELQWACGSGLRGLRVTVGLYCGSGVTSYSQEPPLPNPGILWTISELTNQHSLINSSLA